MKIWVNVNLKQKHLNDDFHGNKNNSARNMIVKEKQNILNDDALLEIAIDIIEKNFSGIQSEENKRTSLEIFKEIFHEMHPASNKKNKRKHK